MDKFYNRKDAIKQIIDFVAMATINGLGVMLSLNIFDIRISYWEAVIIGWTIILLVGRKES